MALDPGLSWALVATGIAAQGAALMLARRPLRLLRAGGRAEGTVVECDEAVISSGRGSPRKYFLPVVDFTTKGGELIVHRSTRGGRKALEKGSRVEMIYDPENPRDAELATFRHLWLFPSLISAFGLPFLIGGLGALL